MSENETKPVKLSDVLQTEDEAKQVAMIQSLAQAAFAQVIALTIVADPRTGDVSYKFIGADKIPFDLIYDMLESVRATVMKQERTFMQEQAAKAQPAAVPQPESQ